MYELNMSQKVYYTMIDHRDYITQYEIWNWDKIKNILNHSLMPEFKVIQGVYCPKVCHFQYGSYDIPMIYVPVSKTVNYSDLDSGYVFTLSKQDEPESCMTQIRIHEPFENTYIDSDSDDLDSDLYHC